MVWEVYGNGQVIPPFLSFLEEVLLLQRPYLGPEVVLMVVMVGLVAIEVTKVIINIVAFVKFLKKIPLSEKPESGIFYFVTKLTTSPSAERIIPTSQRRITTVSSLHPIASR